MGEHAAADVAQPAGVEQESSLVCRAGAHRVDRADPNGVLLAGRHAGHQQDDLGGVGGDGGVGDRPGVLHYGDLKEARDLI